MSAVKVGTQATTPLRCDIVPRTNKIMLRTTVAAQVGTSALITADNAACAYSPHFILELHLRMLARGNYT